MIHGFSSIADCALCAQLPEKAAGDWRRERAAAYAQLRVVVTLSDAVHAYATSLTRLLQCPHCGTYYYYNHYKDDGEHFMDPTSDEEVLRRYDPVTALDFLARLAAGAANALPPAAGQLVQALLEGAGPPATPAHGLDAAGRQALRALSERYADWMTELQTLARQGPLAWPITPYVVTALVYHCAVQGDWDSLDQDLLQHPAPELRLLAARLVLGIGTQDAPVVDLVQTPARVRAFLRQALSRARMQRLVKLLLELARGDYGETWVYEDRFNGAGYFARRIRYEALYGLAVAASHGGSFMRAAPALLRLCLADPTAAYHACWALQNLTAAPAARAQSLLTQFERFSPAQRAQLTQLAPVRELLHVCRQRAAG